MDLGASRYAPFAWWLFDAPEPRRRTGGMGTPKHEVLAYRPSYSWGMPDYWIEAWEITYYSNRKSETFQAEAYDPNDPPTFESDAAYLGRHGLLTAAERRRLPTLLTDAKTPAQPKPKLSVVITHP